MDEHEAESEGSQPSLGEIGDRFRDDLRSLRDAVSRRREELGRAARGYVEDHPFVAVGVAFAAGYVLAGGLLSRTTFRLARVGARLYLGNLLRGVLGEALGGAYRHVEGDGHSPGMAQ